MFGSTDVLQCFPLFKQISQFQKNLIREKATIYKAYVESPKAGEPGLDRTKP